MTDWSVIILPPPRWVQATRSHSAHSAPPPERHPQRFLCSTCGISNLFYRHPPAVYTHLLCRSRGHLNYRRRFLIFLLCAACTSVLRPATRFSSLRAITPNSLGQLLSPGTAGAFVAALRTGVRNEHQATARCQAPPKWPKGHWPESRNCVPRLYFSADDAALKYLGPQLDALSIPGGLSRHQ